MVYRVSFHCDMDFISKLQLSYPLHLNNGRVIIENVSRTGLYRLLGILEKHNITYLNVWKYE